MPSCPHKLMEMIGASFGIAMLLIVLIAVVVPYVFYLITLQKAFQKIRPAHRKMEPGLVWLSLIPLVGIVWQFFVVTYLADGLAAEFKSQGKTPNEARPGYGIGLAKCICAAAGIIPGIGKSYLYRLSGFVDHPLGAHPQLHASNSITLVEPIVYSTSTSIPWAKISKELLRP